MDNSSIPLKVRIFTVLTALHAMDRKRTAMGQLRRP